MYNKSDVKMGQLIDEWKNGTAKTVTFSVTEVCNLACKYCYMTGKNSENKMSFETAKKVVDYLLSNRSIFNEEAVIWEFVGGEPFVEVELVDQVSDYIKQQMFLLDHPWFTNYRFSITTNGLLYNTPKVQDYIRKNKNHISITITVDGNKQKHDLQRVKLDGSGSYDDVIKNVPLWLKQFPHSSTKSTFAHDDLQYLKDSIISLWENGIKTVAANIVFEDVWLEGDEVTFEKQLKDLADYVIDNKLWNEYSVRFLDPSRGLPLNEDELKKNFCGAGKMLAIDYKGDFFPCIRFLDFTLNNRTGYNIGNVEKGIDLDKIRPFRALTLESQSPEECLKCEVASGCAWCTGYNYDSACTETIYERSTAICNMHKANVRAIEYFWDRYSKASGLESPREVYRKQRTEAKGFEDYKYLQFITSDNITPHCCYNSNKKSDAAMSETTLEKGMKFAKENGYIPVFLGKSGQVPGEFIEIDDSKSPYVQEGTIVVLDNNAEISKASSGNFILLVSRDNVGQISQFVKKLYPAGGRVNIILEEIEHWVQKDVEIYSQQLDSLCDFVFNTYEEENPLEINVLTDIFSLKSIAGCGSGVNNFALAPNGKLYLCPAFYFDDPESSIGDLDRGINIKSKRLFELKNAPLCSSCDANHCKRCLFINKKMTKEINTPPRIQCLISHVERNASRKLQKLLATANHITPYSVLSEIAYADPYDKMLNRKGSAINE